MWGLSRNLIVKNFYPTVELNTLFNIERGAEGLGSTGKN